jgi:hypothetical protein
MQVQIERIIARLVFELIANLIGEPAQFKILILFNILNAAPQHI